MSQSKNSFTEGIIKLIIEQFKSNFLMIFFVILFGSGFLISSNGFISKNNLKEIMKPIVKDAMKEEIVELKKCAYSYPVNMIATEFEDKLTNKEVRAHALEINNSYIKNGKDKAKIAALRVIYRSPEAIEMLKKQLGNDEYYNIIEKTIK